MPQKVYKAYYEILTARESNSKEKYERTQEFVVPDGENPVECAIKVIHASIRIHVKNLVELDALTEHSVPRIVTQTKPLQVINSQEGN
jgi:hypothetical protein